MKLPYLQLFTGDWLKDPQLSLCKPATRGVWIDLICAMHELDRSGELRGTSEQLARLARCSTVELAHALTDLQTTGAANIRKRNSQIIITNKRMKRDALARRNAARRAAKHRQHKGKAPTAEKVTPMSRESNAPSSDSYSLSVTDIPKVVAAAETRAREPAEQKSAHRQQQQQQIDDEFLNRLQSMRKYRERKVDVRLVLDSLMLKEGLTVEEVTRNHLIGWCDREWQQPTPGGNGHAEGRGNRHASARQERDIRNADAADELERRLREPAGAEALRGGCDGDHQALVGIGELAAFGSDEGIAAPSRSLD
jgi:hypothetical protein